MMKLIELLDKKKNKVGIIYSLIKGTKEEIKRHQYLFQNLRDYRKEAKILEDEISSLKIQIKEENRKKNPSKIIEGI